MKACQKKPKTRVILSGVPGGRRWAGTESMDPGGPIKLTTSSDRRGPSTALRPPFRLRSAQDDTIERFILGMMGSEFRRTF